MSQYILLKEIGISKDSILCYETLLVQGQLTAKELGLISRRHPTDLYRILNNLESKGFVTSLKTNPHPIYFQAVPLETAIEKYFEYQLDLIREIIGRARYRRVGL